MDERGPSLLRRLWRLLDGLRRLTLNAVFYGLLAALLVALWGQRPKVPSGAALVVRPRGAIVEQLAEVDPVERLLARGAVPRETLLKDLVDGIRAAKGDGRIKAVFLDLDEMGGAGQSKLAELRAGIAEVRKAGKKVVAYSDGYGQSAYYLAAQADELYLHPQGYVALQGFGRWRNYYKEGLDRLGVEIHVFRVGEYKSFAEPFLRNDMSPEAREMSLDVYGDLWRGYLSDVAAARKTRPEDVASAIDGLPERLRTVGGDLARLALEAKLVDRLAPRDEVRRRMIELVGEDKETKSFRQVELARYLEARGDDRLGEGRGPAVAVVVAKGEILDGQQPAGQVGGDSTARLIRRAREDDAVKALVLRVDSPGGSAFASEVIRRECELTRTAGKPVVVSMGSVAASGGYWIATASDEIWAAPETITGSIGIFGLFPTVDKPLARHLGVHTDGVGTTRFTDALRPDRPLDPALAGVAQQVIEHGYEEFLARVSEARKMTRTQVDKIARGRIWSGEDARRLGLVDQLGGFDAAVAAAAARAKLAKGYRVWFVQKEKTLRERVLAWLADAGLAGLRLIEGSPAGATTPRADLALRSRLREMQRDATRFARWNDPRGTYAHCLCGEE